MCHESLAHEKHNTGDGELIVGLWCDKTVCVWEAWSIGYHGHGAQWS